MVRLSIHAGGLRPPGHAQQSIISAPSAPRRPLRSAFWSEPRNPPHHFRHDCDLYADNRRRQVDLRVAESSATGRRGDVGVDGENLLDSERRDGLRKTPPVQGRQHGYGRHVEHPNRGRVLTTGTIHRGDRRGAEDKGGCAWRAPRLAFGSGPRSPSHHFRHDCYLYADNRRRQVACGRIFCHRKTRRGAESFDRRLSCHRVVRATDWPAVRPALPGYRCDRA